MKPKRGSAREAKAIAWNKRLEAARHYAHYSIKEGCSEVEDWENLTDEELVKKAEDDGDRGDAYAEAAADAEKEKEDE